MEAEAMAALLALIADYFGESKPDEFYTMAFGVSDRHRSAAPPCSCRTNTRSISLDYFSGMVDKEIAFKAAIKVVKEELVAMKETTEYTNGTGPLYRRSRCSLKTQNSSLKSM